MAATGTPTPNIGLRRAQGTDPASVDDINYNSALIDTKLGAVGNSSVQDQIDTLNSKFTIKSKTFSVNTGGASQVTFDMDNIEQIPIHVACSSNDIFSLVERTGARWKFTFARLVLETSVHNGYFYEAMFNAGRILISGTDEEKRRLGKEWLLRSAEKGYDPAMDMLRHIGF